MRLIDADKLLHQGYDYVVDGIAYDSCNKSMDIEDIPISECQKAYDVAVEYLRSNAKISG